MNEPVDTDDWVEIELDLDEETIHHLKAMAEQDGITVDEVVSRILREALDMSRERPEEFKQLIDQYNLEKESRDGEEDR